MNDPIEALEMAVQLNECKLWVRCFFCGFESDVYGEGDRAMWREYRQSEECPKCGGPLRFLEKQYIEV